jgi:NDP-sugar pyrophosphorylase family protein/aminoglycoside/choline kinase family phosphotransferase
MPDRPTCEPVRGMVLAAGHGTRLWPLTYYLPKPLLPVLGETLLDRAIGRLGQAGCARIAVNTHHLAAHVAHHLAAREDCARFQLSHEKAILGTGGALDGARAFLEGAEHILLHNGDVLCDVDLAALLAAHRASGAVATLVLTDWPAVNSVRLGPDGIVRDVADRLEVLPSVDDRLLTYTGVAAFSRAVLALVPAGASDLVSALVTALRRDPAAVRAVVHRGQWADLGTVSRYLDAHAEALGGGFVWAAPDATVAAGADLRACVVLPGAAVAADAAHTRAVIGPGWVVTEAQNQALSPAIVRELGFGPETSVTAITGHGSDRRFWRLDDAGHRAVVMRDQPGADDLARSIAVARFLHLERLGAAAVLGHDLAAGVLVSEDLGDDTLLHVVRTRPTEAPDAYAHALDLLARLQTHGSAVARDRCPEACDRSFDREYLRWETDYFRDRFLVGHCGLDPAALADLTPEFTDLAAAALAQPQVIVHRDFQSQNILLKDGQIRLVDVQGMRLGPVAHDLMALLRDCYVDLDPVVRNQLRDRHRERLDALNFAVPDIFTWRAWCTTCGLQRIMQALGAFGYLGHAKHRLWYLDHIPLGLRHLRDLLADAKGQANLCDGAPPPLPRLTAVVAQLAPAVVPNPETRA